jgi:hypothetical protein
MQSRNSFWFDLADIQRLGFEITIRVLGASSGAHAQLNRHVAMQRNVTQLRHFALARLLRHSGNQDRIPVRVVGAYGVPGQTLNTEHRRLAKPLVPGVSYYRHCPLYALKARNAVKAICQDKLNLVETPYGPTGIRQELYFFRPTATVIHFMNFLLQNVHFVVV